MIDPRLSQVQRRCVLAHELVHDERGGGCDGVFMPTDWQPVVARDERLVDDVAVQRLVPYADLVRFVVSLESACVHVEVWHVAEEFHVTERVARRAMELMNARLSEAVARVTRGESCDT